MTWLVGMKATLRHPVAEWWNTRTGDIYRGGPQFREVYRVSEVVSDELGLGLSFAEFHDIFESAHFRPVKTADISCFQQMLAPKPRSRVRA